MNYLRRDPAIPTQLCPPRPWAAEILALPDADILRRPVRFPYAAPSTARAAAIPRMSLDNRSCSLCNCCIIPDILAIEFPHARLIWSGFRWWVSGMVNPMLLVVHEGDNLGNKG